MSGLANWVEQAVPVIEIRISGTSGSTPRDAGAVMYVTRNDIDGTIGGGVLEFQAIAAARDMLRDGTQAASPEIVLGPDSGQCCGGRVRLSLTRPDRAALDAALAARARQRDCAPQVLILGAGHVGRALARALSLLPVQPVLIDARDAELALAAGIPTRRCLTALPEAEIRAAPPGTVYVVATHDHGLDFMLSGEALARGDAVYVGMIGSATKRARFESWHRSNGLGGSTSDLICPIGVTGKGDKRPEVIATFVAAEIMAALAVRRK